MSSTIVNTEELFRFTSTRAPQAPAEPEQLLELADDSDVPLWLTSAAGQDYGTQFDALSARWQAFSRSTDAGSAGEREALLTSLWKFFLQGIASGEASTEQLHAVQQAMGQLALFEHDAASALAGHHPRLRLPAAFERHLRERRERTMREHGASSAQLADDTDLHVQSLLERLDRLESLERRLQVALELDAPAGPAQPFTMPAAQDAPVRSCHMQPAADLDQHFWQANTALLEELGSPAATRRPGRYQALDELRRQIADTTLALSRSAPASAVSSALLAARPALRSLFAASHSGAALPAPQGHFGIRPVGVADLRVLKQVVLRYEKGELAHIENVIDGEERERHHTRSLRIEESKFESSERETAQVHETQSTARFDMGKWAYQSAREQQYSSSGINISTNYGDVFVNASTYMGSQRSADHSRGEDLRYSREVLKRAVDIARERVSRQSWRTVSAEVHETTIHRQTASGANVTAQYRWVDKVCQAQLFNIGARAMYEVMVPQPAAQFAHLLARHPGQDGHAGPAPQRPELHPADITDATWTSHAERFAVTLPAPPAAAFTEFAQASYPGKHAPEGVMNSVVEGAFEARLAQEQGYQAARAGCSMSWYGLAGQCGVTASIGTCLFASDAQPGTPIAAQAIGVETTALGFSASGWGELTQYCVNFYVVWVRTERALAQWQLTCHRIIMDNYQRLRAEHALQVAAQAGQDGPYGPLTELRMRTIERTELKRAVIDIVRRASGYQTPPDSIEQVDGAPAINVAHLAQAAREVRFVETAFEWDQMTYRFHPYFWANAHNAGPAARFEQQGDSVFTAFLNAGFASVILPVRSGFEDAAALYLHTGLITDLAVVPADPAVATMNLNVRQRNEIGDDGLAEGAPWTYRIPTSLVVLDDASGGALPDLALAAHVVPESLPAPSGFVAEMPVNSASLKRSFC